MELITAAINNIYNLCILYMSDYYKKNRKARIAYGKKYYIEHRVEIRSYQNNYHKRYYCNKTNKMSKHEEKYQIKLKIKKKKRKKEIKERKLVRKYWNIWYDKVFGERENKIRELLTLRFD